MSIRHPTERRSPALVAPVPTPWCPRSDEQCSPSKPWTGPRFYVTDPPPRPPLPTSRGDLASRSHLVHLPKLAFSASRDPQFRIGRAGIRTVCALGRLLAFH